MNVSIHGFVLLNLVHTVRTSFLKVYELYLSACVAGRSASAHPRLSSRSSVSIVPTSSRVCPS